MRPNNFDLLRLLAALQVVYCHGCWHLGVTNGLGHPALSYVINWFPGVPIFFTISGFLISRSWERSTDWREYATNRLLRIYPALWTALLVCVVLTASLGFITASVVGSSDFFAWIAAQLTIGQFYNPPFLRDFGVGALNGSLWTIPVELGFYLSLPVLYFCVVNRLSKPAANVALALLALMSFAYWIYLSKHCDPNSTWTKLQLVSPLPHLHMFLFGVLVQGNFERIRRFLEGHAAKWGLFFAAYMLALNPWGMDTQSDNSVAVLGGRVLLALTVVSFAFSWRSLSERLLHGNDISYGVYLYHMPVVNTLVHFGWRGGSLSVAVLYCLTVTLATLSWRLIERRAIALKRQGSSGACVVPIPAPQPRLSAA